MLRCIVQIRFFEPFSSAVMDGREGMFTVWSRPEVQIAQ